MHAAAEEQFNAMAPAAVHRHLALALPLLQITVNHAAHAAEQYNAMALAVFQHQQLTAMPAAHAAEQ